MVKPTLTKKKRPVSGLNSVLFILNVSLLLFFVLKRDSSLVQRAALTASTAAATWSSEAMPRVAQPQDYAQTAGSTTDRSESSASYFSDRNICHRNPYLSSIQDSPEVIAKRLDKIRLAKAWDLEKALVDPRREHNQQRFRILYQPTTCNMTCVGGNDGDCKRDGNYWMCGFMNQNNPVLYSIGSNNKWKYEYAVLQTTPYDIYTFDCTGDRKRFDVLNNNRSHFQYECLAGTKDQAENQENYYLLPDLAKRQNHTQVDLMKMDVEGYEWDVFQMFKSHLLGGDGDSPDNAFLPMQIVFELHYHTLVTELEPEGVFPNWKTEQDYIELYHMLMDLGYIVAKRQDHRRCSHCTQLTLIRYYC